MAEVEELEQVEVEEDRFIVDSPEKADWALYKLREVNKTIDQNKKQRIRLNKLHWKILIHLQRTQQQ